MPADRNLVPIIEPSPAYGPVVQSKSRHPNNMQRCSRGCAQSRDISGILGNLWLDESDAEHRTRCKQIEEKQNLQAIDELRKEATQNNRNIVAWKAFAVPLHVPSRPHTLCPLWQRSLL